MSSVAIVPAAGRGTRFGAAPKLLARIGGVPMLERTVRSLLDAGAGAVVVVLGDDPPAPALPILADPRVHLARNPDPSRGMFSSIQAGAECIGRIGSGSAPEALAASGSAPADPGAGKAPSVVLVLPGDMPFVSPNTIERAARACRDTGRIVIPLFNGKRGHPIALPGPVLDRILAAPPDATLADLRDAWAAGYATVPVDDPGVVRDVDTPADL